MRTIFTILLQEYDCFFLNNIIVHIWLDQSRHIVKDLRSVLLVADQNGHITRYVPEPTPIIAQPAVQAQQRVIGQMPLQQPVIAVATDTTPQPSSTPKCDEMAAKMPKCTVSVLSLSDADMKEIKAKLARTGNIRSIEAKKKTLPRKIFFD